MMSDERCQKKQLIYIVKFRFPCAFFDCSHSPIQEPQLYVVLLIILLIDSFISGLKIDLSLSFENEFFGWAFWENKFFTY